MLRWLLIASALCLLTHPIWALPLSGNPLSPGEQCRAAIATAERGHAIPAQLLSAIGRVESGRRDPGTGAWGAWPWTINAEGQGSYFETKADAIRAVEALRARGVRSIDVGCMQVNLMHHPNAFTTLDMAFEPAVNADYAARFLGQLHDQTGDWTKATANYHSAYPPEGGPYAEKVMAIWPEEQRRAGAAPPLLPGPAQAGLFARALPSRPPPRMYAMAGMVPGRLPAGMMRGETAPAGMSGSTVTPPGMMQGGTIPVGTLPPGYLASRMTGQAGAALGQSAGHDLAFYRAAPIGVVMPVRPIMRVVNRVTMR
jgi:hypothetical protein